MAMTDETFFVVSRGIFEHYIGLATMGLYFYLLGNCTISGKNKGRLAVSIRDLANDTNSSPTTVVYHVKKLIKAKLITYQPAKNQHQVSIIKITKYKTMKDFAVLKSSTAVVQHPNSSSTAVVQHPNSSSTAQALDQQKQAPNKVLRKYKESKGSIKEVLRKETRFDEFWKIYPKKVEKEVAKEKYIALLKQKVLKTDLIVAARNYANACQAQGTESRYIQHPKTFLTKNRHKDWINPPPIDTRPEAIKTLERSLSKSEAKV